MKSRAIKAEIGEIKEDSTTGSYKWGSDDKLPNKLLKAIQDSGTAMSCVNKLKAFIVSDGFVDPAANDHKVNPKQTARQLFASLAPSLAIFEGFALNVLWNNKGEIGSVYRIPVKTLRPKEDGTWRYNPLMGERGYDSTKDVVMKSFKQLDPKERAEIIASEIKQHKKQLGDILMVFNPKEIHNGDILPMPDCYSGIEDIESDAALQRQEKRNIKKGFKANTIIYVPGEIDDQTKDDVTGKTDLDNLVDTLETFSKEDGAPMALIQGKFGKDGTPVIVPYPVKEVLDGVDKARDRVGRAVCRHMNTQPVLIGYDAATILGNTQALSNAFKMMVQVTQNLRALVRDTFKMLWPDIKDWSVSKPNIIEYLDPSIVAKLTDDEIRKIAGYDPIESKVDTETKSLAEIIGLGGIQSLVGILTDAILTPEQKRNALTVLFNISEEDAKKLVPDGNNN